MTRSITPHKGGRTCRAPDARMTPRERFKLDIVLQRRGVKYINWLIGHVEADYAEITGGHMDIVTAYNEDRTVHGNYKDLDTAIKALKNEGYDVVTRGDVTAIMERPAGENVFAHLLKPEYRADAETSAKRISIEPSRVSGL